MAFPLVYLDLVGVFKIYKRSFSTLFIVDLTKVR